MAEDSAEKQIRQIIDAWLDATNRKDAAAVCSFGTDDIVLFSLPPPLIDENAGPEGMQAWFDTWDGPLDISCGDLVIAASDDVAFAHGLSCMRGTKKEEGPVELWFRQTLGFRMVGGNWKIVHEHASVPFYMDGSGKAATDLKP